MMRTYPGARSQSPEPFVLFQLALRQPEIEVGKVRMTDELLAGVPFRWILVQAFLYYIYYIDLRREGS